MGERYEYSAICPDNTSCDTLLRRLSNLPGFATLPTVRASAYLSPSHLPDAAVVESLSPTTFTIHGRLLPKKDPTSLFTQVLQSYDAMSDSVRSEVRVGFEEKSSHQSKRAYDCIYIRHSASKWHYGYSANGSRVSLDSLYRREFMARLGAIAELPLTIQDRGEHFGLAHSSGGILWTSGHHGPDRGSPDRCCIEVPNASPISMLERLNRCLNAMATAKRFDQSWCIMPTRFPSTPTDATFTFKAVLAAGIPADTYDIEMDFPVHVSDSASVEAVRHLCGPKDLVSIPLARYQPPESDPINIGVDVAASGFTILLDSRSPIETQDIQRLLAVEFTQC